MNHNGGSHLGMPKIQAAEVFLHIQKPPTRISTDWPSVYKD